MRLIVIFLALSLSGCGFTPTGLQPIGTHPAQPVSNIPSVEVKTPADFAVGARIRVADPALPGPVTAVVGQPYTSALGQTCYRLRIEGTSPVRERLALCRDQGGQWQLAPRIWSQPSAVVQNP